MKQILVAGGIHLTKSLGQNFLHDANQLRRIIEAADLEKSDKVLEIGPGLGPLTEWLVAAAALVLAIEKDARLFQVLQERFNAADASAPAASGKTPEPAPGLHLVQDDALDYLRREQRDWGDWKLVANLPYCVASPILVELAQSQRGPQRMVATLQIEVAQRLMAKPGEADYGVLTLLVQVNYQPLGWFKIPASCFFPEPDIDSACVSLARRHDPLLTPSQGDAFIRIVKRAFSQRRKMMLKLLKTDWPAQKLEPAFGRLQLPSQVRAETVSLEQFVRLTRILASDS
ncbi:MAG TPA: 16S rRNA (adenine(1518)-N(6)/adenine(1519)-N(6))-dimethyltransferase RsmA [Candidatus Binatia bacterium]|nr:16S rRNA (adenine(1518)-N(6)/adenine(1519)-N(6))-dimethyltransferase RsmA [Candidatus Binatia bacterium]